ncbi:trypsin-1-like [Culicoides brevitarsis]|uniref:trypsin-1-like n=1 Tax=Culicoides brevitarsis TaxID=469753 RepID=UPI00307C56EC
MEFRFILLLLFTVPASIHGKHIKSSYSYKNEPKIVGGFNADLSSTRFIASLRLTIEEEYFDFGAGHKCGASLITENILISAAHCFFVYLNGPFDKELRDPCDWTIVLGVYDRTTKETTTIIRSIEGLTVHDGYDDNSMENDIALIFLNESVPLQEGVIETISLNDREVESKVDCQAHGWGRLAYGGELANELQSVNISTIDPSVCNGTESYGGEIYDGMLCVGALDGGKDSCQGDSGGPLICDGLLTGVVSWGNKCAEPNYPGIYTDVNYFSEWISAAADAEPTVLSQCQYVDPSTENPVNPSSSTSESTSVTTDPTVSTTPSKATGIHLSFGILFVSLVFGLSKV